MSLYSKFIYILIRPSRYSFMTQSRNIVFDSKYIYENIGLNLIDNLDPIL